MKDFDFFIILFLLVFSAIMNIFNNVEIHNIKKTLEAKSIDVKKTSQN